MKDARGLEILPDMFPGGGEYKSTAYPAAPGSGPDGKQCRNCVHFYRSHTGARGYSKCELRSGSHSTSTDISMYSKACHFFD